jgi:hypothetical protein
MAQGESERGLHLLEQRGVVRDEARPLSMQFVEAQELGNDGRIACFHDDGGSLDEASNGGHVRGGDFEALLERVQRRLGITSTGGTDRDAFEECGRIGRIDAGRSRRECPLEFIESAPVVVKCALWIARVQLGVAEPFESVGDTDRSAGFDPEPEPLLANGSRSLDIPLLSP